MHPQPIWYHQSVAKEQVEFNHEQPQEGVGGMGEDIAVGI